MKSKYEVVFLVSKTYYVVIEAEKEEWARVQAEEMSSLNIDTLGNLDEVEVEVLSIEEV